MNRFETSVERGDTGIVLPLLLFLVIAMFFLDQLVLGPIFEQIKPILEDLGIIPKSNAVG